LAVTVAVKVVDPVVRIAAGLADTVVVVPIRLVLPVMLAGSVAVTGLEPPPETVTWLVTCDGAFEATFTVTVIAG
jgi:hypothetical protein